MGPDWNAINVGHWKAPNMTLLENPFGHVGWSSYIKRAISTNRWFVNHKCCSQVCKTVLFMCNAWLNCTFKYWYSQNLSKRQLLHNSVNDLHGSGQVLIYQMFQLIRRYLYRCKFIHVVCYSSFMWAAQLIRGLFHLYISICWFVVIRALIFVFCSSHNWTNWWSRKQRVSR
jgi:hypothetical protein